MRHDKPTLHTDEASYNAAIVQPLQGQSDRGYRPSRPFQDPLGGQPDRGRQGGRHRRFPGFEVVTKEGVHFLCLFDPETPLDAVQARIHACGIHDDSEISTLYDLNAHELFDKAPTWGAQVIAAHVASTGGIFKALQGDRPAVAALVEEILEGGKEAFQQRRMKDGF